MALLHILGLVRVPAAARMRLVQRPKLYPTYVIETTLLALTHPLKSTNTIRPPGSLSPAGIGR